MKKKILIVVPTLSAGGSERFVSILFNKLDRSKFEIKLIILNSSTLFYELDYLEDVYFLKKKDVKSSILTLVKIIRSEAPHYIFSTITSLNILLAFIRICHPTFKLIVRESTILSIHFKKVKNSFLYEIPIRVLYRFSDRIICQSTDMLNDLHQSYGIKKAKLIVINNPILMDSFPVKPEGGSHSVKLITIGRLDPAKGYDRILRALSLLKFEFEYLIIGDFGNDRLKDECDRIALDLGISDKIKWVGLISDPENYLKMADVYVHGSYYEGFPNALLEAGAVGVPIVSFDTKGIGEIIEHGVNGYVVPDNDLTAFSLAIEEALINSFDSHVIRQIISKKFSSEKILSEYQNLFS